MRGRTARQRVAGALVLEQLRAELSHRGTGGDAGRRQRGLQSLPAGARVPQGSQQAGVSASLGLELLALQFGALQSDLLPRQRYLRTVGAGALAKRRQRLPCGRQERIINLELGLEELAPPLGLLLGVFRARAPVGVDHLVQDLLRELWVWSGIGHVDDVRALAGPDAEER